MGLFLHTPRLVLRPVQGRDVFVGAPWQGQGLAKEVLRVVVEWLFGARGHHRLTIDPAADNVRALADEYSRR